jgi:hypothetical protein
MRTGLGRGTMARKNAQSGWVVVEMMGDDRTIIFDGGRPRSFGLLNRLKTGGDRASSLATSLNSLALDMKTTGVVSPVVRVHDGLRLVAEPVIGPRRDPGTYAVKVWIGPGETPLPSASRTIGTMLWDPRDLGAHQDPITYHDPVTDGVILGYDPPAETRVSAQVFKHYQNYPNEHLLGPWVAGIMEGAVPDHETFDDEIDIVRTDGELLRIYLTMRAVKVDGSYAIRGIIHDISDHHEPTGWRGWDRQTARAAIRAFAGDDGTNGCGHVNFATGIVLEWYTTPPGPLEVWERQNARWDDEELYFMQLERAKNGERVTFSAVVRFDDGAPHLISVTIVPADSSEPGNGLLIVTPDEEDDLQAFHPTW